MENVKGDDDMELDWHGRYDYGRDIIEKYVIDKGGIYMISVRLKNKKYSPIYIGKTRNLETRLLEHLSDDEENGCIKNNIKYALSFRYCYVNNEYDRKNIEHTLYNRYTPECNKIIPEGKEIIINFPY